MIEAGKSESKRDDLIKGMSKMTIKDIQMSPEEFKISHKGDKGQAESLLKKKRKSPSKK